MADLKFETNDLLLLTGAGYTKNFGGFLGAEMFIKIFNNPKIQNTPRLKELLQTQDKDDFEAAYAEVFERKGFSEQEQITMANAVETAYQELDEAIKGWVSNETRPYPVSWSGLNKLISLFNGSSKKKGLFFTLNQDLFMERRSSYAAPGASRFPGDFYRLSRQSLARESFIRLPPEKEAAQQMLQGLANHSGLSYIKLHGSYGWLSSDGSNRMVVGKNKLDIIMKEPLLRSYFELFQNAIRTRNKKLLIIGYGFHDQHINLSIVDAVKNYDLQIFIISIMTREKLKYHFEHGGHFYAKDILKGLSGYFPYSLQEMFPADQSSTTHFRELEKRLRS